ncbi:hypothetical protein BDV95DRAFT_507000 [Massariosphaeria phaeospora]|uniref:Uncharacterized protein n=1 Tax=Massariosphaeria phaeospora TaxID=100035 RepID=A0A7C8I565_9PLEO|nr:hypothetical protein BDV95DRAFT_507000 [Massariosphaeria phaeospora]
MLVVQTLAAGDRHRAWKLSLRAAVVVASIIGSGCVGWAVANAPAGPYVYAIDDWAITGCLVTFGVSALWCSTVILVFWLRRPTAPVHPGVAVALDLLLWLAYIATVLFGLMALLSWHRFGDDGQIGSYSAYGTFLLQTNGTWLWNATEYDSYFGRQRSCDAQGRYARGRFAGYGFDSCEAEDAYINSLWQSKPLRIGIETTSTVCQFVALALHFALFIWACIDTHHRNSTTVNKDAERLAADIVVNMVKNGALVQAPGIQTHPPMAHPMMPQQQQLYNGAPSQQQTAPQPWLMQPYPTQSYSMQYPQGAMYTAEKSNGPRYA